MFAQGESPVRFSSVFVATSAIALSSLAFAQTPPDYGTPISGQQAKVAAAAAIAVMKSNDWRMAVAVVDPAGNLVYFEKIDATQHASVEIAMQKAKSAAAFKRPTKVFGDGIANNPGLATLPGVVASEGGVPIIVDGKLIGAIGCSGGSSQQDGTACSAGAAAIK
jgi:glc operon protein GlcG